MNCLFYDQILNKKIPCKLVPNHFPPDLVNRTDLFLRKYIVKVEFDFSKYLEYNLTEQETLRYSSEYVNFMDLYPANTQEDIDYANACIPNLIPDEANHKQNELNRFEKLINMFCSTDSITSENFYILCDFISYELLFRYHTHEERVFLLTIANVPLTQVPENILCKQTIRLVYMLRNKYIYTNLNDIIYRIENYRNISEFNIYTYPIILNIPVFYGNIEFLYPYV